MKEIFVVLGDGPFIVLSDEYQKTVVCEGCLDKIFLEEIYCEEAGKHYCSKCSVKFLDVCTECGKQKTENEKENWFILNGKCEECWSKSLKELGLDEAAITRIKEENFI